MLERDLEAARATMWKWGCATIVFACLVGCAPKKSDPAVMSSTGSDALLRAQDLYAVAGSGAPASTDMGKAYEEGLNRAQKLEQDFERRFQPLYTPITDMTLRTQPAPMKKALELIDEWPKAGNDLVDKHIANFDMMLEEFSRISRVPLEEVKQRPALAATREGYEEYRQLLTQDSKPSMEALRELYMFWLANPKGITSQSLVTKQIELMNRFGKVVAEFGTKDADFKRRNDDLIKGAMDSLRTKVEK